MSTFIPSQLRWACRRGMLELDILLTRFLEHTYPSLSQPEKNDFEILLQTPDPQLLAWLMGEEQPQDETLSAIVHRIRCANAQYHH